MPGLGLEDEGFNTRSVLAEAQLCLKSCEAAVLCREALENQRYCAADRSIEGASPCQRFEDAPSAFAPPRLPKSCVHSLLRINTMSERVE